MPNHRAADGEAFRVKAASIAAPRTPANTSVHQSDTRKLVSHRNTRTTDFGQRGSRLRGQGPWRSVRLSPILRRSAVALAGTCLRSAEPCGSSEPTIGPPPWAVRSTSRPIKCARPGAPAGDSHPSRTRAGSVVPAQGITAARRCRGRPAASSTTGACRTGGETFPIRSASLAVTCHGIHYLPGGERGRGAGRELPHPVDGHDRRREPLRRQLASVPAHHIELISERQP